MAAYNEEAVIAGKVRNVLALDYPRERLEVIVASDGSTDRTVELARAAGADAVIELPRGGKAAAQDAGRGAGARRDRRLLGRQQPLGAGRRCACWWRRSRTPFVGYVCGQVRFTRSAGGSNEEGAYWRYEMAVRSLESGFAGITAGNGAIYARAPRRTTSRAIPTRATSRCPSAWPSAACAPCTPRAALAEEPMVPTLEGEFRRKRRMMSRAWGTILRGGMLSPRGYRPLFAFELASHRLLRYASPFLHLIALGTNIALLGHGWVYTVTLALQVAFFAAAALGAAAADQAVRGWRATTCSSTASIAVGLWDWLRGGAPFVWETATETGDGSARESGSRIGLRGRLALVVTSPLLLAAVVAIRLESRGPALFRQRRVGRDGEPFELYKLRTMAVGSDRGPDVALTADDPRITRVGALLRRYSLDELPNLVNVLRGEMAIVGPRPTIQSQVDRYTERQRRRLEVKPGLTGWAQVNGRVSLSWPERIELDVWYVEHRSLRLDLRILARTLRQLVTGHGLYTG